MHTAVELHEMQRGGHAEHVAPSKKRPLPQLNFPFRAHAPPFHPNHSCPSAQVMQRPPLAHRAQPSAQRLPQAHPNVTIVARPSRSPG